MSTVIQPERKAPDFLLIYTAPGKNPSYRRGVLDAICYPNGHLIPYSYRQKNIQPSLLRKQAGDQQTSRNGLNDEDPRLLIGKEAVIIFVDSDGKGKFTYFPLRRVRIQNSLLDRGTSSPPSPKERIKLSLELHDYVEYKDVSPPDQWHALVQAFDAERKVIAAKPTYFVIAGEDKFAKCPHSPSIAWEELVGAVSKTNTFAKAVFLRLNHLKTYRGRSTRDVVRKYEEDRLVYLLRPGQICRLDLSIFEDTSSNASPGDGASLEVKASAKDSLDVDQPHQSFVSGLDERSVLIVCKRSIENVVTTLSVRTERKGVIEQLVNSPSPTLFVRIAVSWWMLSLFLILVFLGGIAVSIDTELVKESWIKDWPVTTTFAAKTIGAAFLTVAAFLAFRKLPSGQR